MSSIDSLMRGSIDMHVHFGPDPRMERRMDALEGARQAQKAGMRAIVLKNHDYPTAPLAQIIGPLVPDIAIIGSITLNFQVGGLNVYALEASAKLGAKVIWMPTMSSRAFKMAGVSGEGLTLLDKMGGLVPAVGEILDITKHYQMVVATGHISVAEAFALVSEVKNRGLSRVVVTHAIHAFTVQEQRQLADMGAFIEQCFIITTFGPGDPVERVDPSRMAEVIRTVGAERCILCTDFGQASRPAPCEGMRMMIATMLDCGLSEQEIEILVKVNPARLLGLD